MKVQTVVKYVCGVCGKGYLYPEYAEPCCKPTDKPLSMQEIVAKVAAESRFREEHSWMFNERSRR